MDDSFKVCVDVIEATDHRWHKDLKKIGQRLPHLEDHQWEALITRLAGSVSWEDVHPPID